MQVDQENLRDKSCVHAICLSLLYLPEHYVGCQKEEIPRSYEEVCDHSMFVTHFDTTSNTIAIEEISHFAYIFCYRAHIKENKKKWRLP